MVVKYLLKQSPGTKPPHILQRHSFDLVTIVIVINVVIGEFSEEDLKRLARWKRCSAECLVWKVRSMENVECGKCEVWKMRSVENV